MWYICVCVYTFLKIFLEVSSFIVSSWRPVGQRTYYKDCLCALSISPVALLEHSSQGYVLLHSWGLPSTDRNNHFLLKSYGQSSCKCTPAEDFLFQKQRHIIDWWMGCHLFWQCFLCSQLLPIFYWAFHLSFPIHAHVNTMGFRHANQCRMRLDRSWWCIWKNVLCFASVIFKLLLQREQFKRKKMANSLTFVI